MKLIKRRAKGGFLIHLVKEDGFALCGHKPRNHKGNMSRAGWTTPESAPITRGCEQCLAKQMELNNGKV